MCSKYNFSSKKPQTTAGAVLGVEHAPVPGTLCLESRECINTIALPGYFRIKSCFSFTQEVIFAKFIEGRGCLRKTNNMLKV